MLVKLSRFHRRNVKEKKIKMLCLRKYHLGMTRSNFETVYPGSGIQFIRLSVYQFIRLSVYQFNRLSRFFGDQFSRAENI